MITRIINDNDNTRLQSLYKMYDTSSNIKDVE